MILDNLQAFADALQAKFALPGQASPEDQLKPLVAQLLESSGAVHKLKVTTRTETHLSEHKVRPDIAVYVDGLIYGYVELKAPGLGADAPKLKGEHNKKQWEKLKGLPNLIYTDGREWSLYRNGTNLDGLPMVRLQGDPTDKGNAATGASDADQLERLFQRFFDWQPNVPHTPSGLAKYLAPLTRFLRSEVESALGRPGSAVGLLAREWRQFFFPDSDDAKFADAYAQTVTYAMLLARLSGAQNLDPTEAAKTLDKNNGLLARTLELLGQTAAREDLAVGFEMLKRSMEALDPHTFLKSKPDLWLYFYEDFLAAYDPKLRKDYGVYYTPYQVVELQVRLVSELLEHRFGKKLGFADDGVVFLDPAVGTGTYPVAAVKHGLERVRERSGLGAVPARARQMAQNMYGFEILVGPYAVAHLRLTQALEGAINDAKATAGEPEEQLGKRLNIYLADTLESPNKAPPGGLDLTHKALTNEHEAAREVKNGGDILVCLGNPPYDRQQLEDGDTTTRRKGGWVREGDGGQAGLKDGIYERGIHQTPILDAFLEPARQVGHGLHLKNIYNDYVYFWRWALWRLFEQQSCGGIVTFITASSYLAGPGFVGMREVMRRTFDDLWIIDLGGDNLGTRKTPNVFNIQTPVAIAIGVRGNKPTPHSPAKVRYTKIDGATREEKLNQLTAIDDFADLVWQDCPDEWHKPFLPVGTGDFFGWPRLDDLFPWRHSGVQFKRSWPIGETAAVVLDRIAALYLASEEEKPELFVQTSSNNLRSKGTDRGGHEIPNPARELVLSKKIPHPENYGFRSFDKQFAVLSNRLADRIRPELFSTFGPKQIYFTSLFSEPLANGAALVATAYLPDLHHFRGSFGGKDVIPLYLNAAGTEPNVTSGLLDALGKKYGTIPSAEDLVAYTYGLLASQSYTRRFWNELETPGPRVPITEDGVMFNQVVELGRRLIWLHTYAERFQGKDQGDSVPKGTATTIKGVSDAPENYPETATYDSAKCEINVGGGRFGPVSAEIWEFEVSGLKVVQSWLGYRMKKRAGKKSSVLDEIRPKNWSARMSDDFLELLWVLEATLGECQDFRVWSGIMGKQGAPYVSTQRTCNSQ